MHTRVCSDDLRRLRDSASHAGSVTDSPPFDPTFAATTIRTEPKCTHNLLGWLGLAWLPMSAIQAERN